MPPVQSALYSITYQVELLLNLISCICMSLPDTILANQRSRELMRSPLSEHYLNETSQPRYVELHIKLKRKRKRKKNRTDPLMLG